MLTGQAMLGMGWVGLPEVIEWRTRGLLLRLSPIPLKVELAGSAGTFRCALRFTDFGSGGLLVVFPTITMPVDIQTPALRLSAS
jgi:hypothetical protein